MSIKTGDAGSDTHEERDEEKIYETATPQESGSISCGRVVEDLATQ